MLLAGDIGGTKTILAVYSAQIGLREPLWRGVYASADFPTFEALLESFSAECALPIERASFGVAGPVIGGRVAVTNLPWELDERALAENLRVSLVCLLNDLESIAYSVPLLQPHDLETLNAGRPEPRGAMAVIAPGTGLGEAYLTWHEDAYRPHPSEGGHTDFGPNTPLELELLGYLLSRMGHVSYEKVCSGRGIPNLYAFLRDTGRYEVPAQLAEQIAATDDPTPVIVNRALGDEPCALCRAVLDLFVGVLAAEASNLALTVLSTGGLYLGGGIPPRIVGLLRRPAFLRAFRRKGRMERLLADMPVHVILNPEAALLGAAACGLAADEPWRG